MNEQACTVVCVIFTMICAGLFFSAAKFGDQGAMILGMVFSIIVTMLSGCVVIHRYL